MHSDVAIIIPSRIGSTRLPRKALAKIGQYSLIEHVIMRLKGIASDNLYVATDSDEIAKLAHAAGAIAIMTDEDCPSGSDRVLQAFDKIKHPENIKYIINVQGDMPFVSSQLVNKIIEELKKNVCDIVTPAVKIDKNIAENNSNVKIVINSKNQAMYFSRSLIPHGGEEFLYHVGIYGFSRNALEKFVNLPQSQYENIEKLEQLRALENDMKIGVCMSDDIPISVDTPDDLEKAQQYYSTLKI